MPRKMTRSALMLANMAAPGRIAREDSKQRGWVSEMVPRPAALVKAGMPVFSMNSTRSFAPSEYQVPLPAITTGCFAAWIISIRRGAFSISTGRDGIPVAMYLTCSVSVKAFRTSTGYSRYTGPGRPLMAVR